MWIPSRTLVKTFWNSGGDPADRAKGEGTISGILFLLGIIKTMSLTANLSPGRSPDNNHRFLPNRG